MNGKKCTKCGETKPLNCFYNNKASCDGHTTQCMECLRSKSGSKISKVIDNEILSEPTPDIHIPSEFYFYEYKPWYAWVYGGERNPMMLPPKQEVEDVDKTQ